MASVSWRDGIHLTGTGIWCDARRRRDVCFVSSADRVGRAGHGQLIATAETLALLGVKGDGHLGVPLRQKFTLGTLRLELLASGRGVGAAALHVDNAGRRVLYAGTVRTVVVPGLTIEAAEVRACDTLVVAAPCIDARLPPLADAIAQTIEWVVAEVAAQRRPVLYVETLLDGLEVAMVLANAGVPAAAARSMREVAKRADKPLAISAPGREVRPIVWLDADREGLARAVGDRAHSTARLSGLLGDERTFAWSNAADRSQLLGWIESTSAREIFVTGECADSIATQLGPRARVIGPPHQMALFPPEGQWSAG